MELDVKKHAITRLKINFININQFQIFKSLNLFNLLELSTYEICTKNRLGIYNRKLLLISKNLYILDINIYI